MADRIESFATFYPWYLGQHAKPATRWLHFVGTTGFFAVVGMCLVDRPLAVAGLILATLGLGRFFFTLEARRSAAPVLLAIIVLGILAHPRLPGGVVMAYFFAWVAHFGVEGNRPATFTYPLWSLAGDFRMWGEMACGKRWTAA